MEPSIHCINQHKISYILKTMFSRLCKCIIECSLTSGCPPLNMGDEIVDSSICISHLCMCVPVFLIWGCDYVRVSRKVTLNCQPVVIKLIFNTNILYRLYENVKFVMRYFNKGKC